MINYINDRLQTRDIPATVISIEKVSFGGYRYIYTFEKDLTVVKEHLLNNQLYGDTFKKYCDDDPEFVAKDAIIHDIFNHYMIMEEDE